jgi:hypothetical protein
MARINTAPHTFLGRRKLLRVVYRVRVVDLARRAHSTEAEGAEDVRLYAGWWWVERYGEDVQAVEWRRQDKNTTPNRSRSEAHRGVFRLVEQKERADSIVVKGRRAGGPRGEHKGKSL